MNKKKKSTNTSPYPDEAIERLARAFYPAILACWNSEEGQREFAAWQAEQAHLSGKEKQSVPDGERPVIHIAIVCGFLQGASGWAHPVFVFMETHAVPYATSRSFLRIPNAVVSYKTCPANLARTSKFCVPSELFHLPSSSSFNTFCPAQTSGNQ